MALSGTIVTNNKAGRVMRVEWTCTQSIPNNCTYLTWSLYADNPSGSNEWVAERTIHLDINGTRVFSKTERVERRPGYITSGSMTLYHDNLGRKSFSIYLEAAVYTSSISCTGSGSFTLNTIPRQATLQSAPNFTDLENPTITFNNPAGSSASLEACLSYTGSWDDIKYRPVNSGSSSYTFNFTKEEREKLQQDCNTSNNRLIKFFLKTVIGGNTFYSVLDRTLTIVNAQPTINPIVEDNNSTTLALTGNKDILIKGYSNAKYQTNEKFFKFAEKKKFSLTNNKTTINTTSGIIQEVVNGSFNFYLQDSRNNSIEKTITKEMINYIPLTCNLNIDNPSTTGETTFNISGNYFNETFGLKQNTLTLRYRYGVMGTAAAATDDWIVVPSSKILFSNGRYSFSTTITELDYTQIYGFQVEAEDLLKKIVTPVKRVKTQPLFDWSEEDFQFHVPVGFDKYTVFRSSVNCNNGLKVNGVNIVDLIYPVGSIYLSVNSTSPETLFGGKWEQISQGRCLLGAGTSKNDNTTNYFGELNGSDLHYFSEEKGGQVYHTLTIEEMPRHYHDIFQWNNQGTETGWVAKSSEKLPIGANSNLCSYVGGNQKHNNMPPYLAVYIWKRLPDNETSINWDSPTGINWDSSTGINWIE